MYVCVCVVCAPHAPTDVHQHCLVSTGNTALSYACCGGHEEVVKILLERGASIEEPNENGHTPLMEAASGGHIGERDSHSPHL